jgi:hypothetical protein
VATFSETEREMLNEMRAITSDAHGNELLVGLTLEETDFYLAHQRDFRAGIRHSEDRLRFLELHNKHERARCEVLGLEQYVKREDPTKH